MRRNMLAHSTEQLAQLSERRSSSNENQLTARKQAKRTEIKMQKQRTKQEALNKIKKAKIILAPAASLDRI